MKHSILLSAAVALLIATPALAAKKVYSPIVEKGEWEVEHYGSYGREHGSDDSYQYKSYTGVGYGLTDWWKVEAEAILTDEKGTSLTYDATELVNHFQFWEEGEMPFDMGLYLAYEMPRPRCGSRQGGSHPAGGEGSRQLRSPLQPDSGA
jgi:hypothetical protein